MNKQTNFLSFFIFKLIAFILVFVALFYAYGEISSYNMKLEIIFSDYKITTYSGFLSFVVLFALGLIFWIYGLINSLICKIYSIKQAYRGSKSNEAIKNLVESSILLGFGNKKAAVKIIDELNLDYLQDDLKDYPELIKALSQSETIPLALYTNIQKFPALKNQIFKKLAKIEYKLGNFDKALEYSKDYQIASNYDEDNNLLLAQIYLAKKDLKAMDGVISSLSFGDISNLAKTNFSNLYREASKLALIQANNSDAILYARKAIDINFENLDAIVLFCEIAIAQKQYDLIRNVTISCFGHKPSFNLFLIIRKFSDLENIDLYHKLVDSCDFESNLDVFLSITSVLNLENQQKEILEKIY